MSHMIAVAFPQIETADAVLGRLRSLQAEHLLELEDACVIQRDRGGHLHLKQAIGHNLDDALPGHFWHRIITQIFPHNHAGGHRTESGSAGALDRAFVEQVSQSLKPEMSALLILVGEGKLEPLIASLGEHQGSIIRAELPEVERSKLKEALAGLPQVPKAGQLAVMAEQKIEGRLQSKAHEREAAKAARRRQVTQMASVPLSPEDLQHIISTCINAARRGEQHALVMRFPSELCSDGGRAINNSLPEWTDTLVGQPKQLYDYYVRELRPAGYHMHAEILDFPGGVPGDVGITLNWAPDIELGSHLT